MEPQTTEILTDLQIKLKMISLIVCGSISVIICIVSLIRSIYLHKKVVRKDRVLSPIQVFTIGVFLSVLFMFIPIYYNDYSFKDTYSYIRPILVSIHNSFRIFIIDCDFDVIVKTITNVESTALRICYSLYAAILYVLAPLLTFGNVLSLFRYIKDRFRYKLCKNKKFYIFSELNESSVVLAKSLNRAKNTVIVYTDVYDHNDEVNYDLFTKAKELGAICLKESITHIDFISKKGDVEIFLIGSNESVNVSQAVELTTELNEKNKKHNVKIFVFSSKQSSSYIIDSVKYDNLYASNSFKLRRIDEKRQLIWNTVPTMNLFDLADRNNKTLSILILGFGSYGMEFFKMITWFCQFEGYKLQINIFDKQANYIDTQISRFSTEIAKNKISDAFGDAQYDIRTFSGVDVLSSGFSDMLLYEGEDAEKKALAERLKATNLAFVSLGDDDVNIEVSVRLRNLFDRAKGVRAKKEIGWGDELVDIYSVVFDDNKSGILYNETAADQVRHLLLNHKDVPYHIHFIGNFSSQYSYKNIYNEDLETCALKHHLGWVDIEEQIFNEWKKNKDTVNLENHEWYFEKEKTPEAIANSKKKYDQYEYYRLSSIAKELYQREIMSNNTLKNISVCLNGGELQSCTCENCVRRKRSEHMLWNAYTRMLGYSKGRRTDRALLHDNLCVWDELSELDKRKD